MKYGEYTSYLTDLTPGEDDILKRMKKNARYAIRKAEKAGVVIEQACDEGFADEYYAQLIDVFAKQSKVPSYTRERVRLLMKHLLPTGTLLLLRARRPDTGKCIATGIYPAMNGASHFWGNASFRGDQSWSPNELLHWTAMRYWKSRGMRTHDWGGGGGYKEKYATEPFRLPQFYQSKYAWVMKTREELGALYYRGQRLVGRWRYGKRAGQAQASGDEEAGA
jgi:hypothetical protein